MMADAKIDPAAIREGDWVTVTVTGCVRAMPRDSLANGVVTLRVDFGVPCLELPLSAVVIHEPAQSRPALVPAPRRRVA